MDIIRTLLQPYFLLNFAALASYFYTRKYYLNQKLLNMIDAFGLSREISIVIVFCFIVFSRYRNNSSLKNFLITAIYYGKILIMILVALGGNFPALGVYATLFVALWFIIELPKYTGPTKMIELSGSVFKSLFDSQTRVEANANERYIFCVFYANFSFNCVLVR